VATSADELTLRQSVRELLDREELRELNIRYAMAIDDRRIDDFVQCFTDDGEFRHVDGMVKGRDAIRDYQNARLALYGPTYHYAHAYTFSVTGDTGTGTVLAHSELSIDGAMFVVGFRYEDEYRREDGWHFASRGIRVLYFAPYAELPGIFADQFRKRWPGDPRAADFPEGDAAWEQFAAGRPPQPTER
jgi:hypothetical protein